METNNYEINEEKESNSQVRTTKKLDPQLTTTPIEKITLNLSPSLYNIGYLSTSIMNILLLCEIIESRKFLHLERLYEASTSCGRLSDKGISHLVEDYYECLNIKIRTGSIELILSAVAATSGIIIPIILHILNNRTKDKIFSFNIDSQDDTVINLLDMIQSGKIGDFDLCFDHMSKHLNSLGYGIEECSNQVYRILKNETERMESVLWTVKRIQKWSKR